MSNGGIEVGKLRNLWKFDSGKSNQISKKVI
jgi:hypothetical protein